MNRKISLLSSLQLAMMTMHSTHHLSQQTNLQLTHSAANSNFSTNKSTPRSSNQLPGQVNGHQALFSSTAQMFYNTSHNSQTIGKVASLQRANLLIRNSYTHSHKWHSHLEQYGVQYIAKDTLTCRPEEPGIESLTF